VLIVVIHSAIAKFCEIKIRIRYKYSTEEQKYNLINERTWGGPRYKEKICLL